LTLDAHALARAVITQLAHKRRVLTEPRKSILSENMRREEAVDQLEE
jgi:hypothetical protein